MGILIEYDTQKLVDRAPIASNVKLNPTADIGVSFIGAGSYAQGNLLPNLPNDIRRCRVLTNSGTTSKRVADKYKFAESVSRVEDILEDPKTNVVFIATRHDTHAKYTHAALKVGKHVFVEKPFCLHLKELDEIEKCLSIRGLADTNQPALKSPQLIVGYNRRFSPHAKHLKTFFGEGPKSVVYRVNAGNIPPDSWIQDRDIGGGRLVGEGCHFVDFIAWLCDADPVRVFAVALPDPHQHQDTISICIEMSDGSVGTVHYFSNGSKSLAKEYVEVHQAGLSGILNDYRETVLHGKGKPKAFRTRTQAKGQPEMLSAVFQSIRSGGEPLMATSQLMSVMRCCFAVNDSLKNQQSIEF